MKRELGLIAAVLLAINLPLLFGRVCDPLIFFPAQAAAGEWWRAATFPLVHVSLYHFLLDASAFLFLYHGLREIPLLRRWGIVGCCTAGSLLMAMAASPLDGGLCGLSGIAHGLMAITGLELARSTDASLRKAGWICVAFVTLKSLFELVAGEVLFASFHLGSVGAPVASTHFGGVLGGLIGYGILEIPQLKRKEAVA